MIPNYLLNLDQEQEWKKSCPLFLITVLLWDVAQDHISLPLNIEPALQFMAAFF